MNLKAFQKNYNGAPISLQEMAVAVDFEKSELVDNDAIELVEAAINFLDAKSLFEQVLEEHNIEIG